MSIDNISRIYTKGERNTTYVFDLPSPEDDEGIVSYSLIISKDGEIKITKLTDYNDLFQKLHDSKTISIKYQSKDYKLFIRKMADYMHKLGENNTNLSEEDITNIYLQFDIEVSKDGNTEELKRYLKNKKTI